MNVCSPEFIELVAKTLSFINVLVLASNALYLLTWRVSLRRHKALVNSLNEDDGFLAICRKMINHGPGHLSDVVAELSRLCCEMGFCGVLCVVPTVLFAGFWLAVYHLSVSGAMILFPAIWPSLPMCAS